MKLEKIFQTRVGDGGDGGGGDGGGDGGLEGGGMRFMISAYTSMGAALSAGP